MIVFNNQRNARCFLPDNFKKILKLTQIWLDDEKKGGKKKKIFPHLFKFTEVQRSFKKKKIYI